jgi:hypothetical protein
MNLTLHSHFDLAVARGGMNARRRARAMPGLTVFAFVVSLIMIAAGTALGENLSSGTIRGSVLDPSEAAVPGATVEIHNPVTGYAKTLQTDDQGKFEFTNVPFNPYHISVSATGFAIAQQDTEVRTAVPIDLKIALKLATEATTVTVHSESADLIETTPTAHTDVGQNLLTELPVTNPAIGFSEIITNAAPGVAADANGLYHPLGEHADTQIVLDNQPISDQQSKVFSNQLAVNTIQSLELVTGAPPADVGDRTSLVINTTTRSGLAQNKPTGDLMAEYGSFGSWAENFDIGVGGRRWGNFLALDTSGSSRFLDAPEFTAFHDKGNAETFFDRVDYNPTEKDSLHLNLSAERSWFQQPNTYDQLAFNQDQRIQIRSTNLAPGYIHLFSTNLLLTFNPYYRLDWFQYFPSRNPLDSTPATVSQGRRLNNIGARVDLTYARGGHDIKGGIQVNHWLLTEHFNLGITDPTFNPVCLNADGSPDVNPTPTDPSGCVAPLQANPGLLPGLVAIDLTRGGTLFNFDGHADIKELSAYLMDSIKLGNWTVNAGVRGDHYNGLTRARQLEPRVGFSYHLPRTNTVLRASYARLLLAPFNEGLLLGSSTGAGGLGGAGFGGFGASPIVPQRRNQFNTGFEQPFGKHLVVDAEYFWKFSSRGSDFDTLFSTPIVFPTLWRKSKIDGFGIRVNLVKTHGFTAYSTMGHARSRYFGPEVGGLIFNSPLSAGAFRIDHDQAFEQTTNLQYQLPKWGSREGPWVGLTWRYDSGLVTGHVPDFIDTITPGSPFFLDADQQTVVGLFCGNLQATLTSPLTPAACAGRTPFGATYARIPAPGTENDDTNPPRITPRHLFDLAVGQDNLFHTDRFRVKVRFTLINLTNKKALYNFLSTFSGTHVVDPRAYQAQLALIF